jgi:hypothetical protein
MRQFILFILITLFSITSHAAIETDVCTTFNPAQNKEFNSTFADNCMYVSRSGHNISGTFAHLQSNGTFIFATFKGQCNSNQMILSWNNSGFSGQFSATLSVQNGVLNLNGLLAINTGPGIPITMVGLPYGQCPTA